tara:strand:- start:98 stop:250 length:153 start_codon:yes stop_codon:yes gene_type:complete
MKVKELRDAIAELDDDVELTIEPVQSFVIKPQMQNKESEEKENQNEGGEK